MTTGRGGGGHPRQMHAPFSKVFVLPNSIHVFGKIAATWGWSLVDTHSVRNEGV